MFLSVFPALAYILMRKIKLYYLKANVKKNSVSLFGEISKKVSVLIRKWIGKVNIEEYNELVNKNKNYKLEI